MCSNCLGTSRHNEPLQAVVENQLNQTALQETNNSILERNRALLQYAATIANSNSLSDKFNYEFVESLVKGGADINIADQCGQSIFHEVARSWDCDIAQFLLDIGEPRAICPVRHLVLNYFIYYGRWIEGLSSTIYKV